MNRHQPRSLVSGLILILSLITATFFCSSAVAEAAGRQYQHVEIQTNFGNFVVQLNAEKAPKTVANFMRYVNDKSYDGTIFHRVIKDFMIQGGGFNSDFKKTQSREPVINEADNGLKNLRGTIAMARTRDPHSATQQFFINTADNSFLDHRAKTLSSWGYTVFGKVVSGAEIIDKINNLKTGRAGPFSTDVPIDTVTIHRVLPYDMTSKMTVK